MPKIIPAILTSDLFDLKNKLKAIQNLSDWVQVDIMDGKFVNNISVALDDLEKIKFPKNLEIHLMVLNPEKYFRNCQKLGAKRVIFHLEAVKNPAQILKEMEKYDFERGMALNPETKLKKIQSYLNNLDLVLLLGVTPGFQKQKFKPAVLEKIKNLKKLSKKIKIGVNGGVNLSNVSKIAAAGVDYLVIGSGLFGAENIAKTFKQFKKL